MHWIPVILILPYFFLILYYYWYILRITPFTSDRQPSVSVSVIVPCRNGEKSLLALLDCLSEQDYPSGLLEIIIVDDNSTDNTSAVAEAFNAAFTVKVLKNNGRGKKEAIRTGISSSAGELMVTTDADCIMGEGWVRSLASFFESHGPDLVIAPVTVSERTGFSGGFQELEFLGLQGITAGSAMAGSPLMCNGANLAFRREAYMTNADRLHPGLDSGDDIFLLHALKKDRSARIAWLESAPALVTADASPGASSFMKQRRRWLSKWTGYDDIPTILTALVTFTATMSVLFLILAAIAGQAYVIPLIAGFTLKGIPDFLVLKNTCRRYGRPALMKWFLPSAVTYPFYVAAVAVYTLLTVRK